MTWVFLFVKLNKMSNKISVADLEKNSKKAEDGIGKTAEKILKALNKENISVEIYLAGSRKMRFLNKKFRGKDKAADVLSFQEPKGFIHPKSNFKKIGEIYLKLDASRFTLHASRLLAHGLLHLFNFHHQNKSDRIKMEKMEQKVLFQITNSKHQITNKF